MFFHLAEVWHLPPFQQLQNLPVSFSLDLKHPQICNHPLFVRFLGFFQRKFVIDDYAKDGGKELFTKMHCIL